MVLEVFPEGCLAESVVTTVWVGVLVLGLLNLRFGWTLSGLVTPGYLVPLLIVKPAAAGMIVLEGLLTYLLVWWFSRYMPRWKLWSSFFGRDRFFALILASILVKVALDGYAVPLLVRYIEETSRTSLDLANNLHSFGLIIVALIANQFWKPGLRRGLPPFVVTIGLTYLIVRYPLMLWTNFGIGSLEYMYEHIAASILASPKAYIVLVITAFIASRMNLAYSWDYNGILIPALLALQWYEPSKILTSLVEAWFIYFTASLILQLPAFRETSIQGARKILLFFNVSFAYKMAVGFLVAWWKPALPATDFYGFGYLLPSLMAMKMHDKGIPLRLTRTTVETSFIGALCACLAGFGLKVANESLLARTPVLAAAEESLVSQETLSLKEQLQKCKVQLYEQRLSARRLSPIQSELDAFSRGLKLFSAYLGSPGEKDLLQQARSHLALAGYKVFSGHDSLWYIQETPPRRGWGMYILRQGSKRGLLLEVPAPLAQWATLEAGAFLFQTLDARALAISTNGAVSSAPHSGDTPGAYGTLLHVFHQRFCGPGVLEVGGYTSRTARALYGRKFEPRGEEIETLRNSIWVTSRIPSALRLGRLKQLVGSLDIRWASPPWRNVSRDQAPGGYAELFLSRASRKRLLARLLLGFDGALGASSQAGTRDEAPSAGKGDEVSYDSLEMLTVELGAELGRRGSNLFVRPTLPSLLFLDEEVLVPLLEITLAANRGADSSGDVAGDLAAAAAAARVFGYRVEEFEPDDGSGPFLVLREDPERVVRSYWGTCIFRRAAAMPIVVEVPHPILEEHTLDYGRHLFEKMHATCLLVAGCHAKCNTDRSSDPVLPSNKATLFNLVNQVILRETKEKPFLVVQVRALGPKPGMMLPTVDALLSFDKGDTTREGLDGLHLEIVRFLDGQGLVWRFADGEEGTGAYAARGSAQARYLDETRNKSLAALWLSPFSRVGYRDYARSTVQRKQAAALGIPTLVNDGDLCPDEKEPGDKGRPLTLFEWLEKIRERAATRSRPPAAARQDPPARDARMFKLLRSYRRRQDINSLYEILSYDPRPELFRIVDRDSQMPFLAVCDRWGVPRVVASLAYRPEVETGGHDRGPEIVAGNLSRDLVKRFVDSGAVFLRIESDR